MESSRNMSIIHDQYFMKEKLEKRPKLLFISHGRDLEKIFMLLDLQGVGYLLCDPEIATIDIRVKEGDTKSEFYFCLGNLSTNAIHGFMATHKCNRICRTLGFKEFEDKVV